MTLLDDNQLVNIKGGGISVAVATFITAAIIFISGLISGYTNPTKCNN